VRHSCIAQGHTARVLCSCSSIGHDAKANESALVHCPASILQPFVGLTGFEAPHQIDGKVQGKTELGRGLASVCYHNQDVKLNLQSRVCWCALKGW
jgi:hypothetical protein